MSDDSSVIAVYLDISDLELGLSVILCSGLWFMVTRTISFVRGMKEKVKEKTNDSIHAAKPGLCVSGLAP